MVVSVATVAFEEIEGKAVDKQVRILPGNVVFNIVGLSATRRSPNRANGSARPSSPSVWRCRITVNLAPADMPK
jgi:magnesium chelatase family protein